MYILGEYKKYECTNVLEGILYNTRMVQRAVDKVFALVKNYNLFMGSCPCTV